MAVSIHIVILYSPVGDYERFIRIQCLCLQGRSQMGKEVVTLYRQGNMCGSLRTRYKALPSHVLSDVAMLLCLIHDQKTYSPFLLQPWRWVPGHYSPAGLCGVTIQKPQYEQFCSTGLESYWTWCCAAGWVRLRRIATHYNTEEWSHINTTVRTSNLTSRVILNFAPFWV